MAKSMVPAPAFNTPNVLGIGAPPWATAIAIHFREATNACPNGRSIVLERQPGADTAGYAGLEDQVDNHWGALFKAAVLSTLLGVGSELGSSGQDSDIVQALRRGASDSANQTGQQIVRRNLNIQPTLTIRPGFPVRVIVNRDLVLEPYKG